MKYVALLALVLSQTTAYAAEAPQLFTKEMRLDGSDARLLFSSMPVSPTYGSDETGPFMRKAMQIGPTGAAVRDLIFTASCELLAGGDLANCALTWTTDIELKAGAVVSFSESASQAIVSRLGLLARPKLGQGWSGLDFESFSISCLEVYSPSDLPVYTACSLSVSK